ncbi:MAG: signal peptide peptidase SppA [Deltaproteobacteria bacterium]|nr:signal peptide peptidase SppA [Deltaproteobacteria bacterium]
MLRKAALFAAAVAFFSTLSGCGIMVVKVPLYRETEILQERVIEGAGRDKILLIDVSGVITEKKRSLNRWTDGTSQLEDMRETLRKAAGDPAVKALLLRISSPGGGVTATDILYHEIMKFKEKRNIPVTACFMDVAASGGYYLAMAADQIVAHPTSITGSIGVIAMKFNVQGLMDRIGIEEESVKSGNMKDIWSPFRPSTAEERAVMQVIINSYHRKFIDIIEKGRPSMTKKDIEAASDGRIFTAAQALEKKLIDRVGYLDDAVTSLKSTLGLSEAQVVAYYRPGDFKETIYSGMTPAQPKLLELLSQEGLGIVAPPGINFMYLWLP